MSMYLAADFQISGNIIKYRYSVFKMTVSLDIQIDGYLTGQK